MGPIRESVNIVLAQLLTCVHRWLHTLTYAEQNLNTINTRKQLETLGFLGDWTQIKVQFGSPVFTDSYPISGNIIMTISGQEGKKPTEN